MIPMTSRKNQMEDALKVLKDEGFKKAFLIFEESINEEVNPCEDFYDFACGKWIANNDIPDDLSSYGRFSALRENVSQEMKDLYNSDNTLKSKSVDYLKEIYKKCMDTKSLAATSIKELIKSLESYGFWPIIHGNKWKSNNFDLTDLLINLIQSRSIDVFLELYVSQDSKNVTRRMLHIDQGSLGLGSNSRDYYLNKEKYAKQISAYRKYLIAKISLLAQDSGSKRTIDEITKDVDEMIDFETEFAKILVPDHSRRNYTELYNIIKIDELDKLMPLIDWNRYFRAITPYDLHDYFNSNPDIIVTELKFFDRVLELLKNTDTRVITNYILTRYFSAWTMQLDERYEDIQQEFLKEFVGKKVKSPRWKDCSATASSKLPYASGAMYIDAFFNDKDKAAAMDMVKDLREAFNEILESNNWMDVDTKKYALEKLHEMMPLIGYPEFIKNTTSLDEYYKGLEITSHDSYAEILQKITTWSQHKIFRRLLEPVDREDFGMSSAVVNAYYSSIKNAIAFPAAILRAPFFDRRFPKSINYGGIGAVIGHEITHGFDDQGSQFDKIGNLRNWWDETTQKEFKKRTKCIVDQYGSYEVPDTGLKINGILTQGENIADNGGIKGAFRAYKNYIKRLGHDEPRIPGFEKYSNDQIFFMSYAQTWCGKAKPQSVIRQILGDPHSPMRFRVNGVMVNQPDFANAFQCPIGSKMNPGKRCEVW
ncbi:Phosphate-regulating neutral endopeptidase [Strongyloides ratti]|uniref:Phosphate-regulating neutral endopeptidase n=1 Tax=Strongyloides ratti TaxID=34506 RepID=A0A090KU73_STRRB|nr:Phosphate-regulating neutral endopeptidase [Strongyloides ratti]CEF59415.1 Phosphate-regulating neutral endopeptidase [Strongyloides ratti]